MKSSAPNILTADIGGTNSRFAHFTTGPGGGLRLCRSVWTKTSDHRSFRAMLEYLKSTGFSLTPGQSDIFVVAVAGPVEDGLRCSPPFIAWDIDVSDPYYGRCILINDFIAQAYSCLTRPGREAVRILDGTADQMAASAIIGAGTALGKAVLVPKLDGTAVALCSEGGHAGFPFETEREFEFHRFLTDKLGDKYITGNTVVSGKGLSYIHQFLTGHELAPQDVALSFQRFPETLEWASRFYGRSCRNFALEILAMGGVYIAGGLAAKNPELVTSKTFEKEFRSSDKLSYLLEKIPVFLIRDENSGLWGAAFLGLQKLKI